MLVECIVNWFSELNDSKLDWILRHSISMLGKCLWFLIIEKFAIKYSSNIKI